MGETAERVDWIAAVQQTMAAMSGNHCLMDPIRDDAGEVVDFQIVATGPETVDAYGRRGDEILGRRQRQEYGAVVHGPVWETHLAVLADGVPRQVGPVPYARARGAPARFTIWMRRVGAGLLVSWRQEDDFGRLEERIAQTERLANLGWSEYDPVAGTRVWSEQLYRIFERDPAREPMTLREIDEATVPEDRQVRRRAVRRMEEGLPADTTFRVRLDSHVKHLRMISDTVRDVYGQPMRTYGIIQDVTARETTRTTLADVEEQLYQHQESLAAENALVAELQQIILPIPDRPFDLPGLRLAVRYLPAETAARIGGDWYCAGTGYDGSVMLAVGDVAGHGIRSAAAMARLRQAFLTLIATSTVDPAELLSQLNLLMLRDGDPTTLASAVVGRYDPGHSSLTWAQAGHPTPLRTRGGVTSELDRPAGPILGAIEGAVYGTATVYVRPQDLLVFYTDGLIERRGRPLDEGLRAVTETLDRLSAQGSSHPLADLLGQLRRANPDDDTCILAVRSLPTDEVIQVVPAHDLAEPPVSRASAARGTKTRSALRP